MRALMAGEERGLEDSQCSHLHKGWGQGMGRKWEGKEAVGRQQCMGGHYHRGLGMGGLKTPRSYSIGWGLAHLKMAAKDIGYSLRF